MAMLASGIKSFLIVLAASSASALAVWLLARAASATARFDGEWRHLDIGRRHHALVAGVWLFPVFLVVVPLIEPPKFFSQYALWTIFIGGSIVFAACASYQTYLTHRQWNANELSWFSWLFGWRFMLFRDLSGLELADNGSAVVSSRWGERLRFDRSLNGAPELIETCRRHIAANTAATAISPGAGPEPTRG